MISSFLWDCTVSHGFDHAESEYRIYFALRVQNLNVPAISNLPTKSARAGLRASRGSQDPRVILRDLLVKFDFFA